MSYVIAVPPVASLAVYDSEQRFPVHRIYCIGQNYAQHAKEMGSAVDRETPVFFCKPADAIVTGDGDVPYPPATNDLHHEVEMIVALARGGRAITREEALECVYGYGVGLDLTRRDLQAQAKKAGRPWDTAKAFDHSAPVSPLRRASECGHPEHAHLRLSVNGEERQHTDIADMASSVADILHHLSGLFELHAGDLLFTGTPAGVAALHRGDRFEAELEGIARLRGLVV
jgi:fumarylpyruvate hydrolase